ncbi:MAG: hypothetical protein PHO67_07820 [Candidatus Omnitrophica bacterium]|nr:hypothetical protein [Candidatus Omnitrophota bacterium]
MKEYPTTDELNTIREWDVLGKGPMGLVEFVQKLWKYGEVVVTGKRVKYLALHTCGWSGNEEIVDALEDNRFFWTFYWQQSKRGGHHWFKIDLHHRGQRPVNWQPGVKK